MLLKIREIAIRHIKTNFKTYFFLFMAFAIGVSAGAFTVNGLSSIQRQELRDYFQGFLQLLENQRVDGGELLKISLNENIRLVIILWILGVTVIGIPFIFVLVGIRGFITGFSAGLIIDAVGLKGVIFTFLGLMPKEFIIVPCIIALGVNGINFSLKIIKSKPIKGLSGGTIKSTFASYCLVTLILTIFIFVGSLVESYITPVFIRMLGPFIIG